jgi:hypothetical protein
MKITDPVSLSDTVWTASHVALFLGQNPDSILTVVNAAEFPKPLTNQKRNRRWLGEDVKEFFIRRSQGLITEPSRARVDVTLAPKSMRLKG